MYVNILETIMLSFFFLSEGVWGLHPLKNVTMPDVESIPEPMVALLQDGTS